jgi:hypothetical protein
MSMSWLIDLHVSSTNDTLRLHDEEEREKEGERKKYLDASLRIHEEWKSDWGVLLVCIWMPWGYRT